MSAEAISQALETRLSIMASGLTTAWENVDFVPTSGTAYQAANVLFAQPENPTFGNTFYRQRGYLQVMLCYPQNTGKGACLAKAQALREWFYRGLSLTAGGVTTVIEATPEIGPSRIEGDRFVVNVFIRFYANIGA